MSTKKSWILIITAVALMLGFALFLSNPKRQMRNYVLSHKSELDSYAEECLSQPLPYRGSYDGYVTEVFAEHPGILLIHWSAYGLVPSGGYCDLLYATDGAPHPYPGMEDYEEYDQMFNWRWVQPDGDNGCSVENIDGNWYYCKAWF